VLWFFHVVGDSLTRGHLQSFSIRNPKRRKRFCYPGAKVEDITDSVCDITKNRPDSTTYIVHVGTNDLCNNKVNRVDILKKYKTLLATFKEKSKNVIISGILPKLNADYSFLNDAFNINRELKWLCKSMGVGFVNTWDSFYERSDVFARDGLHLSEVGSTRLGRMFDEAARDFFRSRG
jgi:lysophospholipase L1-like esterase